MNFDINELTAPPNPIQWIASNQAGIVTFKKKTWFEARQALAAFWGVEPTQLDVRPYAD